MRFIFKFVILLLYIFPSFAHAQEVGSAVKIVNSVKGKIKGKSRTLSKNNPVFSNEKISASSSSHGEFILSDKSRIIVGPNSSVTLDSFLVSGRGFEKGLVNVSKGAFRFISGRSRKKVLLKSKHRLRPLVFAARYLMFMLVEAALLMLSCFQVRWKYAHGETIAKRWLRTVTSLESNQATASNSEISYAQAIEARKTLITV